ncbi:hypothetical protein EVA_09398 [gut metagenome]|uniref:Uncharacterized protein n=1 Tax=gut metagenome TaxID=749906 RepID=J9GK75_9ZZZZ
MLTVLSLIMLVVSQKCPSFLLKFVKSLINWTLLVTLPLLSVKALLSALLH